MTQAEQINVAVATNFMPVMHKIGNEFEQTSGHQLRLATGSSGKFFAQIQHGAPFHLFFSADQAKPQALEQEGLAVPGSRFTYALGKLVLWSTKPEFAGVVVKRLRTGEFNKVALANPRLAPYGLAALEVLSALGLRKATGDKWVQGENIGQTFQFVSSGNADLGFVALSQIISHGGIEPHRLWVIPESLYTPIRQDAVLLKHGKHSQAAQQLLAFVASQRGRQIIESFGYKTPKVHPANPAARH